MSDPDVARWRRRFILIVALQLGGTVMALFGLLLWQTDMVVAGGSAIGFVLALAGLVVSFFGPRRLSRHWKTLDDA